VQSAHCVSNLLKITALDFGAFQAATYDCIEGW